MLCALRFKLSDGARAFCYNGGDGCNCNDDDNYDDNACNARERDNNHADGAWVAPVDGVHHDAEATEHRAAD
jgi:hypothetical protein